MTAACLFPALACAQTVVNDSWLGGTGNWSNPANWSAGVVPNNSSDGSTVYNVTIDSGGTDLADMDIDVTIASLVVGGTKGTSVSTLENTQQYGQLHITGPLTMAIQDVMLQHDFETLARGASAAQEPQADQNAADSNGLWRCPKCGGPMVVVERFTATEIQPRSPPLLTSAA